MQYLSLIHTQIAELSLSNETQDLLLVLVEGLPHAKKGVFGGFTGFRFERAVFELLHVGLVRIDVVEEQLELLESDCMRKKVLADQLNTVLMSSTEQISCTCGMSMSSASRSWLSGVLRLGPSML